VLGDCDGVGMKASSSSESRPEGKVLERGVKGAVDDEIVEGGGYGAVGVSFGGGVDGIVVNTVV
jgi:hypothetical protein